MRAVSLHVFGRVQGVGFRWLTKMVADQLGVTGFVKNEFDGSVYIEAAGEEEPLTKFIGAIKASPTPSGKVDRVDEKELSPLPSYHGFKVTG
ncbi:acylphosphatase [Schleiferilactobacillus shenzhenensis]|uniref:acylphosphatase n=1 Tax=Schleiferilactobacillus shenzhenensis TaxID=1231337 RepID=UPI0004046C84|nr:acylphosphatase [Schleiferilactobacillus shenzhenensis]